jgi:pimeloyl-ACP methyl ester carboxylesterase
VSALHRFGSRYITTPDGAELWCQLRGEGRDVVVLADGLGCDGFIWKYLAPALARDFRVLRFHYRGHGRSGLPRDPTRISIAHFADDLAQILDELGVQRAAIAGHSMGVQVIFELFARHPERVAALIPICGSYGNVLDTWHDDTVLKGIFPVARELVERFPSVARARWKRALPTEMSLFVARYLESRPEILSRADMWPYLSHLTAMDPLAFVRTLDTASHHSAWAHLQHVDVPTLILAAERDRFTPMWLSERMHAAVRGSELVVMPGASHCGPLEMPDLTRRSVEYFLAQRVFTAAPLARPAV